MSRKSETALINTSGRVIESYPFCFLPPFNASGIARTWTSGNSWGLVNRAGDKVSTPKWDYIGPFEDNGCALVTLQVDNRQTQRYGVINEAGQLQIEPIWYSVAVWNDWWNQPWRNDGIHVVSYSPDQWLVLDHDGREIQNLGTPPKCWSSGFDPATCERTDFGFQRYYYDQSNAGRALHRMATNLSGSIGRLASKITEPLGRWSLEYEILDNSGQTLWSTVQSQRRRQRAILSAVAGGLFLVWSFGKSQFGSRYRSATRSFFRGQCRGNSVP